MGFSGGAPSWVYKEREATITSSYESHISALRDRIKQLEAENAELKTSLETMIRKYDDCKKQLISARAASGA